ncbi:hypothetical protein [Sediminitomix flava]|uniref:Arginyl-tRNA--protein-N-Asp/Glu arginylyltransferase n=1 Tax=Sediminitomix flava TaxID=379075 RepID=A0A315ZGG0_SEDFL|nr:hypothetical protein [Sediminitomix flava]PWJ44676.1 arginyl-tRNA--protein-N-Asp/Glu arginylyltransferase [Sediminitomix flava]
MIAELYKPIHITPKDLDDFLASGGTRDGGYLNRLEIVYYDNQLCTIIPLRINIAEFEFSKSQRKLLRRNDKKYKTIIRSAVINKEKEALYQQHKVRFKDFQSDSILWFFESPIDGFKLPIDTQELVLLNEDKELIACSFFDKGLTSMYSILGLYDQSYHRDSLGIYTMLKEIEYAQKNGLKYYYIGYVFDRPSLFDYKLNFTGVKGYLWKEDKWFNWGEIDLTQTLGEVIREKLLELKDLLFQKFSNIHPHFNGRFFYDYLINKSEHVISLPFLFYLKVEIGNCPHVYAIGYDHYKKVFWVAFDELIERIQYFDLAEDVLNYLLTKNSHILKEEVLVSEKLEAVFSKLHFDIVKKYDKSLEEGFIRYNISHLDKELSLQYNISDFEYYLFIETEFSEIDPIYVGNSTEKVINLIRDFFYA